MEQYPNIVLINSAEIIGIVRRSLSKIDPRLVDHGERVGYIAGKICAYGGAGAEVDPSRLFVLCVLHDIGAYKTEEIDQLVKFETEVPFEHARYGYLFLKNTTHLANYAEALLYHHTPYSQMAQQDCKCAAYAQLIHLADRVDILLQHGAQLSVLRGAAGSQFNPRYVDALLRAEEREQLSRKIVSGGYQEELSALEAGLHIESSEIMDYLKLLVYAIDFRSPYTVTHTVDTAIISHETGLLLGLNERELQLLYLGGFLHDIGKIAMPHEILEKPGKLTGAEYAIIRQHIDEGEKILRGVVSDELCDIALRHHEKLDGSGYSRGLRGDQLTMPQRIVAVADILSALSQRRAYKEPYSKERVLEILTEMRDAGQLCPRVVDAVCQNYDLILDRIEKNHDPIKELYGRLVEEYAQLRSAQP